MNKQDYAGIILASESPRRKELLSKMELSYDIIPSGLVEMPPMGESPGAYSARMAMEKAVAVGSDYPDHLVIGADTVVAADDKILGKPKSPQDAALMLSFLSGRWHEVWTGICVFCSSRNVQIVKSTQSSVLFKQLTGKEIEEYVNTGEPMDKAGAYAIQGLGKELVREIKGSYHNIIGLPTFELSKILSDLGILLDSKRIDHKPDLNKMSP